MATVFYCTSDDIIDRLGDAAVALMTDDAPPNLFGNAIREATAKINAYLLKRYPVSSLQDNDWVNMIAGHLAAHIVATRRGNPAPASVGQDAAEAIEDLKAAFRGEMDVPEATPRRISAPVMSNVRIPLRPHPHPRVSKARSTTTGGTPRDYNQRGDMGTTSEPLLDQPQP